MCNDYVIVHSPADLDKANELHEMIASYGYVGRVHDNSEAIENSYSKARHVLVCVSNNIVNKTFLAIKGEVCNAWLRGKAFRLIPVYLHSKTELTDEAYRNLYGLASRIGFYMKSKFFEADVKRQFDRLTPSDYSTCNC